MAMYGSAAGLKERTFELWVFNRRLFHFCVRSALLRCCGHGLVTLLPHVTNDTLKWLTLLPILMHTLAGGDEVALRLVPPPLPRLLESRSSPVPVWRQHGVKRFQPASLGSRFDSIVHRGGDQTRRLSIET